MNLADLQRTAEEIRHEIERAETLGAVPVAIAEVDEFCCHVLDAKPEDCEECGLICDAANDFERAVNREQAVDAGEELAKLLVASGCFAGRYAMTSARSLVDDFSRLVYVQLAQKAA
jgi:hypothetical protein